MFSREDLTVEELAHFGISLDPWSEIYEQEPFLYPELLSVKAGLVTAMGNHQMMVLAGDSGSGKSTLLRQAVNDARKQLGEKVAICAVRAINPARVTDLVIEECLLDELVGRIPTTAQARSRLLEKTLLQRLEEGKRTVLILDDAHLLSPKVFFPLRQVREFGSGHRLLSIILIGEPNLEKLLAQPEVENVFGRTRLRAMPPICEVAGGKGKIAVMKPDRTGDLLTHIWDRVGMRGDFLRIWSDPAAIALVGQKGRYPLNIVNICIRAMKTARRAGLKVITPEAVNMVGAL